MKDYELKQVKEIKELLYEAQHAVFFGGAGVSTESGIPDFRGASGLYSDASNEYYLSRSCLYNEPEKFFSFYRKNMLFPEAKPNKTHIILSELEKKGIIKAVITQNIDGLHQKAGSKNVIELHGTTAECYCMKCKKSFRGDYIEKTEGIPRCDKCGGTVRPDVTLYEENLDGISLYGAKRHIEKADMMIVGGTSLNVYPAAGFVAEYAGEHLVIVNLSPTPYDSQAEYVIRASLSEFFHKMI